MNNRGEHAGVTMYGGKDAVYAICNEQGARLVPMEPFLSGNSTD